MCKTVKLLDNNRIFFFSSYPTSRLCCLFFQVFRTDECVCVYTLHGHADSISCLSVDKVRCKYKIEHDVMQLSGNNLQQYL